MCGALKAQSASAPKNRVIAAAAPGSTFLGRRAFLPPKAPRRGRSLPALSLRPTTTSRRPDALFSRPRRRPPRFRRWRLMFRSLRPSLEAPLSRCLPCRLAQSLWHPLHLTPGEGRRFPSVTSATHCASSRHSRSTLGREFGPRIPCCPCRTFYPFSCMETNAAPKLTTVIMTHQVNSRRTRQQLLTLQPYDGTLRCLPLSTLPHTACCTRNTHLLYLRCSAWTVSVLEIVTALSLRSV